MQKQHVQILINQKTIGA